MDSEAHWLWDCPLLDLPRQDLVTRTHTALEDPSLPFVAERAAMISMLFGGNQRSSRMWIGTWTPDEWMAWRLATKTLTEDAASDRKLSSWLLGLFRIITNGVQVVWSHRQREIGARQIAGERERVGIG